MDRKTAIERGLPRYYTGIVCKNGHQAERITVSGACTVCAAINRRRDRVKAQAAINQGRATRAENAD